MCNPLCHNLGLLLTLMCRPYTTWLLLKGSPFILTGRGHRQHQVIMNTSIARCVDHLVSNLRGVAR